MRQPKHLHNKKSYFYGCYVLEMMMILEKIGLDLPTIFYA